MALLDKILGRDEREEKLKQEIKSLELRKESVFLSINNEIADLEREQKNIYLEAGKYAYDRWCKDKEQVELTSYWEKIQLLEKQIKEQEDKKTEMGNRYDEEIKLITQSMGAGVISTGTASAGTDSCPKCGAPVVEDDLFCQSCGTKLR